MNSLAVDRSLAWFYRQLWKPDTVIIKSYNIMQLSVDKSSAESGSFIDKFL